MYMRIKTSIMFETRSELVEVCVCVCVCVCEHSRARECVCVQLAELLLLENISDHLPIFCIYINQHPPNGSDHT